jgi:hypothetical protein
MKDLVTFAPAIRLGYSIMGPRRSQHWLKTKTTYNRFHSDKAAERKSEEVRRLMCARVVNIRERAAAD